MEPTADHLSDPLGDGELLDGVAFEAALLDEQADHLADEEGVALGLGLDRPDERRGRSPARRDLDVLRYGALGQALEDDPVSHGLASQVGQGAR